MPFDSLQNFVTYLEANGKLRRIRAEVNPMDFIKHELDAPAWASPWPAKRTYPRRSRPGRPAKRNTDAALAADGAGAWAASGYFSRQKNGAGIFGLHPEAQGAVRHWLAGADGGIHQRRI